jgi:hypothetical protein
MSSFLVLFLWGVMVWIRFVSMQKTGLIGCFCGNTGDLLPFFLVNKSFKYVVWYDRGIRALSVCGGMFGAGQYALCLNTSAGYAGGECL